MLVLAELISLLGELVAGIGDMRMRMGWRAEMPPNPRPQWMQEQADREERERNAPRSTSVNGEPGAQVPQAHGGSLH
jgi:hypothetical protein